MIGSATENFRDQLVQRISKLSAFALSLKQPRQNTNQFFQNALVKDLSEVSNISTRAKAYTWPFTKLGDNFYIDIRYTNDNQTAPLMEKGNKS